MKAWLKKQFTFRPGPFVFYALWGGIMAYFITRYVIQIYYARTLADRELASWMLLTVMLTAFILVFELLNRKLVDMYRNFADYLQQHIEKLYELLDQQQEALKIAKETMDTIGKALDADDEEDINQIK